MTLHIGQFLKELHHHFQILQGLYLMSTDGALTAQCIELIAYGVDRVEPGIVEGGSSGYIIQGIWEKNIVRVTGKTRMSTGLVFHQGLIVIRRRASHHRM